VKLISELNIAALSVVRTLQSKLRDKIIYNWASYAVVIRSLTYGVSIRLNRIKVSFNDGIFRFLVFMYSTSFVSTNKVITEVTYTAFKRVLFI
jgi:hypothetical protein